MSASAAAAPKATKRAPRQARASAPPLPPLDALDRTHHRMMEVLVDLTRLVDHLEANGVDAEARLQAAAICRFFTSAARQHHADEETHVFPALIRAGNPEIIQHVLRLQQDHGWLEEDWLELSPQLQAVAEGYSWYELDGLRHGVGVFTALYHEHIALEESMIYPAARRRLAEEDASRDQRVSDAGNGNA